MGCLDILLNQPRAVVKSGYGTGVLQPGAGGSQVAATDHGRTFQRGWYPGPSVGIAQELHAQGDADLLTDGGRNASVDFHGEKRTNQNHASTTDPQARLYRKSDAAPAQLGYPGHALMENRHGLIVDVEVTPANGTAEREAAQDMARRTIRKPRATITADKAHDTHGFVEHLGQHGPRGHVAQNDTHRCSAIDRCTTRHLGYAPSQRKRKLIKGAFGWVKTVGGLRKTRFIGKAKMAAQALFTSVAYNRVAFSAAARRRRRARAPATCVKRGKRSEHGLDSSQQKHEIRKTGKDPVSTGINNAYALQQMGQTVGFFSSLLAPTCTLCAAAFSQAGGTCGSSDGEYSQQRHQRAK